MKPLDKNPPPGQKKLSDMIGFWNSKNSDKNTTKTETQTDKDKTAEQTHQETPPNDKKNPQEFVRQKLTVGRIVDETRKKDFRQKLAVMKSLTRNPPDPLTRTPKNPIKLMTSSDTQANPDKKTPDLTRRKRKLNPDDKLEDRSIKNPRILARVGQEGRAKQEFITNMFISSNSRRQAGVQGPQDDCLPDEGGGGGRAQDQVPLQGLLGAAAPNTSTTAQHSRVGSGAIFCKNVKLAVTGQHSGGENSVTNHATATTRPGKTPTVGKLPEYFGKNQLN